MILDLQPLSFSMFVTNVLPLYRTCELSMSGIINALFSVILLYAYSRVMLNSLLLCFTKSSSH